MRREHTQAFMCGALSDKRDAPIELAFARDLINAVTAGFPRERLALHMCRGNWTPDESVALSGGYDPLIDTMRQMNVGPTCWSTARRARGKWRRCAGCPTTAGSVSVS